jgi:RNA polymerase sigma-70 factor (ECF subfamily)
MQLNLKSLNSNTAMKTRNIKADTFSANNDEDLTLCVELIGKNQDKLAFNSIFRYFAPRLKSFLVKAGSTDTQAEEVIQEVMIAVWTKSSTYDSNKSSVSTWIYTIARNKRIDKIRKEKRHYLSESDEGLEIPVDSTQEKEIFSAQVSNSLKKYMSNLPEEQSKLLRLSYFYNKTHADISEELKIPLGTVKSRIRLALTKMRHLVEVN